MLKDCVLALGKVPLLNISNRDTCEWKHKLAYDMCNLSENNNCSGVDVEYCVEYVVQFMCTGGHI